MDENILLSTSLLLKSPFFSGLDEEEFNIITAFLKTLNIKKGKSIFHEGETGEGLFVFIKGAMSAYGTQSDGTKRKIFDIKPGDFFGEMSIITNAPRSATITADEDSVLAMLRINNFFEIISEYPFIGYKLLKAISAVENEWLDQMSKSFNDLLRWGEDARRRAITDEMTGLYNYRFLEESVKERLNNPSMNLRIMAVLMMDLDKIHAINELHGTKGGDAVIISSAKVIKSMLRSGDIPAHLAGDEYAILLPDTDEASAKETAEKIREGIEKKQIEVPEHPGSEKNILITTRASIGISFAPLHASTMEELMETADKALQKAKELGRNRVEVYERR